MHEFAFADAIRPTPVCVLKLPLRDYSIGHEILLLRWRNPLLALDPEEFSKLPEKQQNVAIARAVLICSNDWSANQKPKKWLRLWGWITRNENFALAIADFRNYLAASRSSLPTPDEESYQMANGKDRDTSGRELGAPFPAQLLNFLATLDLNAWGIASIYDFPYAAAAALYFTSLEFQGSFHIENRREAQVRAEMAQHRADIARERAEEARKQAAGESAPAAPAANAGLATLPPDLTVDDEKGGDAQRP